MSKRWFSVYLITFWELVSLSWRLYRVGAALTRTYTERPERDEAKRDERE